MEHNESSLRTSLVWMFIGSLLIGVFLNGMNILAYSHTHLYFTSLTLIYSALFMAINMCLLEIAMHYSMTGTYDLSLLLSFIGLAILMIIALRDQTFVNDEHWLKRMISHHSTAITTSTKIDERTKNPKVRKLARSIIKTQNEEIELMQQLLDENN